ncbi:topoisomerase DNA-binding C4 zinc finger domain-containing protein [Massilia sp. SR12]
MKNEPPGIGISILVFFAVWGLLLLLVGGAVCSDGWASGSIGRAGACSHHGGVRTWPNVLVFFISAVVAFKFHHSRQLKYQKERLIKRPEPICSVATPVEPELKPPSPVSKRRQTRKERNLCPNCGASMVLRIAGKGRNAGGQFWGCNRFPRCKGTRAANLGPE